MTEEMNSEITKVEICKILNRIGALQFGVFKLTSGKMSPYYIDLRMIPSFPDAFQEIGDFYSNFVKEEVGVKGFDRVAGIPIAGIPFASLIAYKLKKPFLYIRKNVRSHGRQKRIEGVLAPGDRVLLIDDLVTTGLSLRKALKSIAAEGGLVKDAVVLLDREEGGAKKLWQDGVKLHALLNIREIAHRLFEIGAVDEEQLETILKQIEQVTTK